VPPPQELPPFECDFRSASDFTYYREATPEFEDELMKLLPDHEEEKTLKARYTVDAKIKLQNNQDGKPYDARVNACRCFSRKYWSLTCRVDGGPEKDKVAVPAKELKYLSNYKAKDKRIEGLNSIQDLCEVLYKNTFLGGDMPKGLVVVAGATKCAKSQITRGLIYSYLEDDRFNLSRDRPPHLITFEDPVEVYPCEQAKDPEELKAFLSLRERWLDYTPREKGKDAASIKQVLDDCLRQTPAVVFIGETRAESDWHHLIRFAGSGHLVFTTTHAGSLTEAMGRIFKATKTTNAQQRGEIAESLLALVHLKTGEIKLNQDEEKEFLGLLESADDKEPALKRASIILPALWVRSPRSAAALMDSGRASLLPNRCDDSSKESMQVGSSGRASSRPNGSCDSSKDRKPVGCFGRTVLAQQLLERLKVGASSPEDGKLANYLEDKVEKQAIKWDLAGV
jgi:hypothetical protein